MQRTPMPSLMLVLALAGTVSSAGAATLEAVPAFGANPGELDLFVYVPDDLPPGSPLVVALHGCTQSAADFDDETGLEALADAVPFLLAMPQQRSANNARICFNFFERGDNRPGLGESASIMAMVDHVEATFGTDPERIYVLGLSAGGGMTAVMLANHPERFAGGGILAGVPFDCNRPGFWTAGMWWTLATFWGQAAAASFSCGIFGNTPVDRTPDDWGDAVRGAVAVSPSVWPRVSIWQGDADSTVNPSNRQELIDQWTDVHGIDRAADSRETMDGITHEVFTDAAGTPLVEAWQLPSLGHAVAIDPEAEPVACGVVGPHMEDQNLCAVREITRFWGLLQ